MSTPEALSTLYHSQISAITRRDRNSLIVALRDAIPCSSELIDMAAIARFLYTLEHVF